MFLTVRAFRSMCLLMLTSLLAAALGYGQQKIFELDPAKTSVNFTVDSTLHTVHGSFQFKRGKIQFDSGTGQASGELVVDSTSGESGSNGRDKRMHKDILESPKYSDIVFTPQHIKGAVAADGKSHVEVDGILAMHGQSHPITMALDVQLQGGAGTAEGSFTVKYQQWGIKNPSTFILRVSDKVEIHVHATGRLTTGSSN
jgi:polyisoprenoid-binding protein YceI